MVFIPPVEFQRLVESMPSTEAVVVAYHLTNTFSLFFLSPICKSTCKQELNITPNQGKVDKNLEKLKYVSHDVSVMRQPVSPGASKLNEQRSRFVQVELVDWVMLVAVLIVPTASCTDPFPLAIYLFIYLFIRKTGFSLKPAI